MPGWNALELLLVGLVRIVCPFVTSSEFEWEDKHA